MFFRQWLESKQFTGISPNDLKWWANYAARQTFKTPEEARQWIFEKRQWHDRQPHVDMFGGPDGPEYNQAFAQALPLYQSGKSWKIGKRVRGPDNRLRLKNLEIRMPDLEYINQVAQANGESDYQLHLKPRMIPIRHTVGEDDRYYSDPGEMRRIQNLAQEIKKNGWFEPVIYDYLSGHIIEGQHRARAMKLLGFNLVPGVGIEYEDE